MLVNISSTNRIKVSQNSQKYLCEEQENSVSGIPIHVFYFQARGHK